MSEKTRGKDLSRLVAMLKALMDGETLDAISAGRRFGINPDPARRNLNLLAKGLSPWVCKERRAGKDLFSFHWPVPGQNQRDEKHPTIAEAIATSVGSAFLSVFGGTNYQVEHDSLRARVVERLVARRRKLFDHIGRKIVVLSGREEALGDQQGMLDDVIEGVLGQTRLKIRYRKFTGEEEERLLVPYSLLVYDAHLYVVGHDGSRLRTHRFARLLKVETTREKFDYPQPNEYDPAVVFRDSIGIWTGEPEPCRVVVRLGCEWAVYARHHRWHQSQRIIAEHSDGAVDLQLLCRPCPELEQWVLRFGEHAQVLEPADFREKVARRLAEASQQYG